MRELSNLGLVASVCLPLASPARAASFAAPETWTPDFSVDTGWRVGRHLRVMGDVDGDGQADIVGFGETAVFVARSTGASFTAPEPWVDNYSFNQGWRADRHLRTLADVDDDGMLDVVGFGERGVYVSLSTGSGFRPPALWLADLDVSHGWRADRHPRFLADVDGDGRPDIVGFGDAGVFVSLASTSRFTEPALWLADFGLDHGWRSERHPRDVVDVDADGRADVVGFGESGVMVALAGSERFTDPRRWSEDYGEAAGWRVGEHPRLLTDVDDDGRVDIVGFGDAGTFLSLAEADRFGASELALVAYGHDQGWRRARHPRLAGDVDGDDLPDIVGFGEAGVYVATSRGTTFSEPVLAVDDFGHAHGWRVDRHVRALADVNGDGLNDIIGFADDGVHVALAEP